MSPFSMHFDPFEGAHMRSKIGILALLTLAGLAVFTERCACQPAHAKADNEVTVSEPVRVILDRAYVYQAHMFSLSWEEDNTVQVYIDRLPGKYTMKMAVAILPNTRPKSFLVLHEIGWDQRVRISELVAFAINYPDQLKLYRSLATRVDETEPDTCARVFINAQGKTELATDLRCGAVGAYFLVVSTIETTIR